MYEVLTLARLSAMDPDAAAALLVYRRAEGAADLDAPVVDQWLAMDPGHGLAFEAAKAGWSDFDEAADDEILAALRADARAAGPPRAAWSRQVAAVAAVVLVMVGVAFGFVAWQGGLGQGIFAPAAQRYEAAGGKPTQVRLADGSQMTLASGSTATVRLARDYRRVGLERGSAQFDVAHDAARPFAVRADDLEVLAIGTRFGVTIGASGSRVVLEQGRVSVRALSSAREPVILAAGQQYIARRGQAPLVTPVTPPAADVGPDQFINFRNVTLGEVAKTLSTQGGGQLIVRDPAVAALRISGRFQAGDLPRFGRSLSLLHPVRLEPRGPKTWEIVKRR